MLDTRSARGSAGVPFLFAAGHRRLIQVHPTLHCNLRCRHCYSESGPERRGQLPLGDLRRLLEQGRALGYDYVGVSGGEPTLWPDLLPFLDAACRLGFRTAITTNGTTLTAASVERLAGRVGVVGVSIDGEAHEHDVVRGVEGAHARAVRGMRLLHAARVPFAVVFTLTRGNLHALEAAFELARSVGALALQVHPLSAAGNACGSDAVPDDETYSLAAVLLALLVEKHAGRGPMVAFDAVPVADLHHALTAAAPATPLGFRDAVPSLVVEADGTVAPFVHGFPRALAVGRLGCDDLAVLAEAWLVAHGAACREHLLELLDERLAAGVRWVDPFPALRDAAARASAMGSRHPGDVRARYASSANDA